MCVCMYVCVCGGDLTCACVPVCVICVRGCVHVHLCVWCMCVSVRARNEGNVPRGPRIKKYEVWAQIENIVKIICNSIMCTHTPENREGGWKILNQNFERGGVV